MDPVELLLLSVAAVFFVGVLGEVVFAKTNVPDVIWLIAVGVLFGPVLGWVPAAPMTLIAPYFGAITLVIVLFNGGTSLELAGLMRSAPRALGLAILSFAASVAGVASVVLLFSWSGALPASWGFGHAIITGAILGGSSSIVIMPAMQQANLRPDVANAVNLESALTDVLCVVVTGAAISIVSPEAGGGGDSVAQTIAASFGIGIGIGGVAGLLWIFLQPYFSGSEHEYPVTLGALFVLYVVVSRLGGSAALAILTTAVMIGNSRSIASGLGIQREVHLDAALQGLHGQITFIVKSFFFTFIGVMLRPPWEFLGIGVVLGAILVIVRVPATVAALFRSSLSTSEKRLIGILLPRGMAAGVLAMMPHYAGIPDTEGLPAIVFAGVVTTILVFALGFPAAKKRVAGEADQQKSDAEAALLPAPGSQTAGPSAPPAAED